MPLRCSDPTSPEGTRMAMTGQVALSHSRALARVLGRAGAIPFFAAEFVASTTVRGTDLSQSLWDVPLARIAPNVSENARSAVDDFKTLW